MVHAENAKSSLLQSNVGQMGSVHPLFSQATTDQDINFWQLVWLVESKNR